MRIGNNIAALIARHNYARAQATIDRSLERLATGERINRAADDPAGLIAADALASRRVTIEETIKAKERAGYVLAAADGALGEIDAMLIDLNAIIVSAANTGGMSEAEREALQVEANGIIQGIGHIIGTTTFDGKNILSDGASINFGVGEMWLNSLSTKSMGSTTRMVTGENGEVTTVTYGLADLLGSGSLNLIDGDLELAQQVAESAGSAITSMRGQIGSHLKYSIGSEVAALAIEHENTVAAESLIRDADIAEEVSNYARGEVLRQASLMSMELAQKQAWQMLELLA